MTRKTFLVGLGVATALATQLALGDDPTARALRERQEQSDAFALQLQQSIQGAGAGGAGPSQSLERYSRQLGERQRQDELFYRQGVQANSPASGALDRAQAMRDEQERQQQLSRFRSEVPGPGAGGGAGSAPLPLSAPTVGTAPVPRAPASPAATQSPVPANARAVLAVIRVVEEQADSLWTAGLQGDWGAAQLALGDLRRSLETLRGGGFVARYVEAGGSAQALGAMLDRLDSALARAGAQAEVRDGAGLMATADELQVAAAEVTADVASRLYSSEAGPAYRAR